MRLFGRKRFSWQLLLALTGLALAAPLAGCGGGGGGGGGGSNPPGATTANITGYAKDKTTGYALGQRTILVQGTSLQAVTDTTGLFVINNVPLTTVTLQDVTDSTASNSLTVQVNVAAAGGDPRNVGTVLFDVSSNPPPPPI